MPTHSIVLCDLVKRINSAHQACAESLTAGLEHALEAGRLLLEAKAQVSHGDWLGWLKANFAGSVRTAQGYARLAVRWPQLPEDAQRVAHLPLREAAKLLADSQRERPARSPLTDEIVTNTQAGLSRGARALLEQFRGYPLPSFREGGAVSEDEIWGLAASGTTLLQKLADLVFKDTHPQTGHLSGENAIRPLVALRNLAVEWVNAMKIRQLSTERQLGKALTKNPWLKFMVEKRFSSPEAFQQAATDAWEKAGKPEILSP